MSDIPQFVSAVAEHWQAPLTGGFLIAVLALYERKKGRPLPWSAFKWIAMLALAVAFYLAWHDEYVIATNATETNSLRKRTKSLADDVERFSSDRQDHHPPYPRGPEFTTAEQAKIKVQSERYDAETERLCLSKFGDRTRGIVQELKAKGVDVSSDNVEAVIEQGRCLAPDWLKAFRNLAYRVDAQDRLVVF
jgi:hypothetical protein